MFLSPTRIQSNRGRSLIERQVTRIRERIKLVEKCVVHLGVRRENVAQGLQVVLFGICFTKGTAYCLLLREIKAFIKGMLVFFINAMLACIWEMVLLFVTGPWLMGPTIPSVADYMVCQTMHVNYSYTGTPLDLLTVNACCLQALSGAEDSFVPALGHSVLLLCQSPMGTLLTPSFNCLHVAKSKTPKTGEPRSCLVGFCLFFFFGLCSLSVHSL